MEDSERAVVITHAEMGIFIGSAMGMGFWSNLDSADQTRVCTFVSEEDARDYVSSWTQDNEPDGYNYTTVEIDSGENFATIAQLRAAGLTEILGELIVNAPSPPSPYGMH